MVVGKQSGQIEHSQRSEPKLMIVQKGIHPTTFRMLDVLRDYATIQLNDALIQIPEGLERAFRAFIAVLENGDHPGEFLEDPFSEGAQAYEVFQRELEVYETKGEAAMMTPTSTP